MAELEPAILRRPLLRPSQKSHRLGQSPSQLLASCAALHVRLRRRGGSQACIVAPHTREDLPADVGGLLGFAELTIDMDPPTESTVP